MKTRFVILLVVILFYFVPLTGVFAQGDYVLPYPGTMPGNRFYSLSQTIDYLQSFWSFGNLSQFTYYLSMADKKLVEAKILFEYKQYLLASKALLSYQEHLGNAASSLGSAKGEGKDTSQKEALFLKAIEKHKEVLMKIKGETPPVFIWQPERENPTTIKVHDMILAAIETGKTCGTK